MTFCYLRIRSEKAARRSEASTAEKRVNAPNLATYLSTTFLSLQLAYLKMAAAIKALNAKIRANPVSDYLCSTRKHLHQPGQPFMLETDLERHIKATHYGGQTC